MVDLGGIDSFSLLPGAASVNIVIRAVDKYSKEFKKVEDKAKETSTSLNKLYGGVLVSTFTAVSYALYKSTRDAIEYEDQLTQVAAATRMTAAETEVFKTRINELAKSIPIAKEDLKSIADVARSFGITGEIAMERFTVASYRLSVATARGSAEAAKMIGELAKVEGLDAAIQKLEQTEQVTQRLAESARSTSSQWKILFERIREPFAAAGENVNDRLINPLLRFLNDADNKEAMQKYTDYLIAQKAAYEDMRSPLTETAGLTREYFDTVSQAERALETYDDRVAVLNRLHDEGAITNENYTSLMGMEHDALIAIANAAGLSIEQIRALKEETKSMVNELNRFEDYVSQSKWVKYTIYGGSEEQWGMSSPTWHYGENGQKYAGPVGDDSQPLQNDFIMRPGQPAIPFSSSDTVVGFKGGLGGGPGGFTFNNYAPIYGVNPNQIADALMMRMRRMTT